MAATDHEVFVVADAHGRLDLINDLIDHARAHRGRGRTIVHLGDLVNCVESSVDSDLATLDSARDLFDVLLVGNHEHPYFGGPAFAGFHHDRDVRYAISRLEWQPAFAVGEFLVTHAGLCELWTMEGGAAANAELLCAAWAHNPKHPYFAQIGRARGGQAEYGGILWADWNEPKSTSRFSQIVGHTPGPIRVQGVDESWAVVGRPVGFEPGESFAMCIDLGASKGGANYANPSGLPEYPRGDAIAGCWIRGEEVEVVVWSIPCAVCGDLIDGDARYPNPEQPGARTHPECEERYWDAPGEAFLTGEAW